MASGGQPSHPEVVAQLKKVIEFAEASISTGSIQNECIDFDALKAVLKSVIDKATNFGLFDEAKYGHEGGGYEEYAEASDLQDLLDNIIAKNKEASLNQKKIWQERQKKVAEETSAANRAAETRRNENLQPIPALQKDRLLWAMEANSASALQQEIFKAKQQNMTVQTEELALRMLEGNNTERTSFHGIIKSTHDEALGPLREEIAQLEREKTRLVEERTNEKQNYESKAKEFGLEDEQAKRSCEEWKKRISALSESVRAQKVILDRVKDFSDSLRRDRTSASMSAADAIMQSQQRQDQKREAQKDLFSPRPSMSGMTPRNSYNASAANTPMATPLATPIGSGNEQAQFFPPARSASQEGAQEGWKPMLSGIRLEGGERLAGQADSWDNEPGA